MARARGPELELPQTRSDPAAVDAALRAFAELLAEMALAVPPPSGEVGADAT